MQATAVIVGISLVIMLAQGLRYGALPAREMTWARPPAGLFLAGVALLVIDMLSAVRAVRLGLHPLPAGADERAAAVLGHLRRQRAGHLLLLRHRRLPGRAAALAGPGRRRRQDLRHLGSGRHGRLAGQREHLQRLHRVVPGAGLRQHVAPVPSRIGHRPADPLPRSTWPTTSWSAVGTTTSPRSSPPTAHTAGSPGAGCWPT